MNSTNFDIVVLGGGLAGLCLARQLAMGRPGKRILVLEKRAHPAPEAAFKVGESSVEIAAHYFEKMLDLGPHLRDRQLPKFGLRFFFSHPSRTELSGGSELGLKRRFPTPSFQLDRGRLENHIAEEMAGLGIDFRDQTIVTEIQLGEGDIPHRVDFRRGGEEYSVIARWVLDASGRAGLIKRKLDLAVEIPHRINAAWFRLSTSIRIDDWEDWPPLDENAGASRSRWLSTNHLVGKGYWVWLIPLGSGCTSLGIVADPRFHPLSNFNRFDRALAWLEKHQPACARVVAGHRDKLMDFLALKHFSYGCKQVFSSDRWALTGDAGVFPDPFYSPGNDFIAIANTMIVDLVERDLAGKPITELSVAYNDLFQNLFLNTLTVYRDQYSILGNVVVMPLKVFWDYAVYWSFPAFAFMQGKLEAFATNPQLNRVPYEIGALNLRMQKFFRKWHETYEPPVQGAFIDQGSFKFLHDLNSRLIPPAGDGSDSAFIAQLEANLELLRELSGEMIAAAAKRHPELAKYNPGNPTHSNYLAGYFETVLQPMNAVVSPK